MERRMMSNIYTHMNRNETSYYNIGKDHGFYETCVLVGNLFTIILSIIWFCYIFHRTLIYLINRIICPWLNIKRSQRNCGCNGIFASQDDCFLNTEDHTLRERGIRIIGMVHCSGFIFALLLIAEFIGFSITHNNDNPFCPFSSVVEQICIWIQMLMFYNYYIWLFIEVCCFTDLEEDERSGFARKRKEIQKRYLRSGKHHANIFDTVKEDENLGSTYETEGDDGRFSMKDFQFGNDNDNYDDDEEEEDDDDDSVVAMSKDNISPNSAVNDTVNRNRKAGKKGNILSRFYENYWIRDKMCFNSLSLCAVECSCYVIVFFVVFLMCLIPGIAGLYGEGNAEWCWIHGFGSQIGFFYGELFVGMILIPFLSFLMWLKYIKFCCCEKGKKLSEDPAVRAIGIKIAVYSFVFLLWIFSFIHRYLAHEESGYLRKHGEEGSVTILAGIQELQMGSYTGVMIIAFFIINFATMYCNSVVSCGVCACWSDLRRWMRKRRKWIGNHDFRNKRIKKTFGIRMFASILSLNLTELRKTDVEMMYIEDV